LYLGEISSVQVVYRVLARLEEKEKEKEKGGGKSYIEFLR
jgi:hypothetical protein